MNLKMKYFVLKPGGVNHYAVASRSAMREYAKVIKPYNPELAAELIEWTDQAHAESWAASQPQEK